MRGGEKRSRRNLTRLVYLLFGAAMLASCSIGTAGSKGHSHEVDEECLNEEGSLLVPIDVATHQETEGPKDTYNEGVVLVKTFGEINADSLGIKVKSITPLYPESPWKLIELSDITTKEAVHHLRNLGIFASVDYDYIMESAGEVESIDVSSNPYADSLPYIESSGIGNAWAWGHNRHNEDPSAADAGGSPDVVVAVIDTGVDYNHIDLRNNIWTNVGEIPNNRIDDDQNGYIDDVNGWDCVNEDNDPNDDNGHGTHVAGIIAAENNNVGTVGVAFNCKVMPVKAGASNGYFTNADIAQAIQYAYMNGASVINMSFGGSSISLSVEEALTDAYYQCSLVAAAGNSGLCNQPGCAAHQPNCQPSYPACLPFVVGVMSCNMDGSSISSFSNHDHIPYNSYEYDCYACGEQVVSTWPNNKYARLSGTSMSSPVVAGIAALLRSAYPDRETFSSKYIHSQLSNAGPTKTHSGFGIDAFHPLCNAYEAMTRVPKPCINSVYNVYVFDNVGLSPSNNGDGFVDAGETIKIGIELQNRGGKATNVTAKIDTIQHNDPALTDPNVTITSDAIHLADIGTYSIRDGGKIYEDGKVVGMNEAFEAVTSPSAPNGYVCSFNLHLEYYNGLEDDGIRYTDDCAFSITINSGVRLSGTITKNTIFTAERAYVITDSLVIPAGVTVVFEEGCRLNFYSNSMGYIDSTTETPFIDVFGILRFEGTQDNPVKLSVNPLWERYVYLIRTKGGGLVESSYSIFDRAILESNVLLKNSILTYDKPAGVTPLYISGGKTNTSTYGNVVSVLEDCCVDLRNFDCGSLNIPQKCSGTTFLLSNENDICCNVYMARVCENNLFVTSRRAGTPNSRAARANINLCEDYSMMNNSFITDYCPESIGGLAKLFLRGTENYYTHTVADNYFSQEYKDFSNSLLADNYDSGGHPLVNPNDEGNHDDSVIWPYIKDISVLNGNNEVVRTVGTEKNKVRVTFSREMDANNEFSLFYGSWHPYSDYKIQGHYVSDTIWEGEFQVRSSIEGGKQFFSSTGGCAKDDSFKTLVDNAGAFTFEINTTEALSMNLQAFPTENGIELTWVQDDYDTLMGYNVYRSDSKDGNYARLNNALIPAGENTFLDDSCEPGHAYWYTFTVVLSDFSESAPAGKVNAIAADTIAPRIYHTPVNQGYAGNNLAINCSISDNIAVASATLFYRTVGEEKWKSLSMTKANDRYSATIFGSEVTMDGLEYYISATDGRNVVTRGSADSPFSVVVKDPSLLSDLGDVDADGTITTKDALMIMRTIAGELILTDDQFRRADLNKDGVLSTFEALRILQYVNGNVTTVDMSN